MNETFTIKKDQFAASIPLIAHVPHSSTYIPPELRATIVLDDNKLQKELLVLTDWYADELFSGVIDCRGISFISNISRLIVDFERFEDDEKESMAKKGMGVIYKKTSAGKVLRQYLTLIERELLLDRFYRPYNKAFEEEVQKLLDRFDTCLILDCHSFPFHPLPYEKQNLKRPDICIGTDPFHTPERLIEKIEDYFHEHKWTTFHNEPFSGTYVPLKFFGTDTRVSSVMIEVNRRMYMNEKTGERLDSFTDVRDKIISPLLNTLSEFVFGGKS